MRLPEPRIRDALLHPDRAVRDMAIRYFYNSSGRDATPMARAIEALEKYGRTTAFSFTHYLNVLPQTEETVDWVVAELHSRGDADPAEMYAYHLNLGRLLCHADIPLVVARRTEIECAPYLGAKEKHAFLDRLRIAEWPADVCWQALCRHCETSKHIRRVDEFDMEHAVRIVEFLARQEHSYREQVLAVLSQPACDPRESISRWLWPLIAKLAGEMRLQAAIPLLIDYVGHANSFLSDQCVFALARIGTDEVVAAVCDRFRQASSDYRGYASDLLGKIPLDSTCARILELLPGEPAVHVRMNLCLALLGHFSLAGVEPARQFVKQHHLDPRALRDLRCDLVAACTLMEMHFPELATWRAEAEQDAARFQKTHQDLNRIVYEAGGDVGAIVQKIKSLAGSAQPAAAEPGSRRASRAAIQHPPRLDRPAARPASPRRAGRNDPCPCGSGKKLKHCCLNKPRFF